MSVEQGVFALAGAVCVIGSVVAVAHRDPRIAGAALLLTLLSLGALYATLAAPIVAAFVVLVTLIAVVPAAPVTTVAFLYLGALLFAAGALGTVLRRSVAARLAGIELIFAGATLTLVAASAGFHELDGQVAALLVIGVAAAQGGV